MPWGSIIVAALQLLGVILQKLPWSWSKRHHAKIKEKLRIRRAGSYPP